MRYCLLIFLCVPLLAACAVEGGVPPATPVSIVAAPPPPPTSLPPTAEEPQGWGIGLLQAPPDDLLPYYSSASDARATAPLTQLLFPPPLLAVGYTYTTTGVLREVPTIENGGAVLQPVDAFLDAAGSITTTDTGVITQAEQLVITYHWNPALAWSDGTPLTAADSVYAYEWAKTNARDDESLAKLAATARYEAVDAHTSRAVLQPDVVEPTYVNMAWTPLPQHLLSGLTGDLWKSEFAQQPVGYGPYTFERRDKATIALRPNPRYPGAEALEPVRFVFVPTIEQLRNQLLNGSIAVAQSEYFAREQLAFLAADEQQGVLDVTYLPAATWEHIDFNLDVPLLQDIRVRRAIAQAIDRQRMVATLLGGQGRVLDSWLLPEQWAAAPADQITSYAYSPGDANRLLDEVGLVDTDGDGLRNGTDGAQLTLRLLVGESRAGTIRAEAAEAIKADLGKIGIGVTIETVEQQAFFSPEGPLFRRQFDLALFAWLATPDPGGRSLWSCAAVPNEGNGWQGENFPGWCFRDADTAIRNATTALDRGERQAAYLAQQQLFTQELPALPLFQRVTTLVVVPGISGLAPDQQAPLTWNLPEWTRR